ncbi:MAG: cyclic pyranopterin monophosphate synthase MoaC [Pirellulales bacterium]|nr:cyclic pyranopterin monophosphate synthase MoaC [Pirellulales bacterium]
MSDLTHFDSSGSAHMVNVGEKPVTARRAVAGGVVTMRETTWRMIATGEHAKGDVLAVARLAGIMGAKQTAGLIPLCHILPLESVSVEFALLRPAETTVAAAAADDTRATVDSTRDTNGGAEFAQLEIRATVTVTGKTGVEMEALTAVSVAALTIYDMCKAVDKELEIGQIRLLEKAGGRSGEYRRV